MNESYGWIIKVTETLSIDYRDHLTALEIAAMERETNFLHQPEQCQDSIEQTESVCSVNSAAVTNRCVGV